MILLIFVLYWMFVDQEQDDKIEKSMDKRS